MKHSPLSYIKNSLFLKYFITFVMILIALVIRLVIAPVDAGLQFVTLFPTVTLAAIIGGGEAGIFATALGLITAAYFFMPPYFSFLNIESKVASWGNLVFVADGIVLSFSINMMHLYRQRSEKQLDESEKSRIQLAEINQKLNDAIAELHKSQKRLQHFKAIIESSNDAIISKTLDGIILSWNQGAEIMFGYQADEIIGKPITILMPSDHQYEELDIIQKISNGDTIQHFETVRKCKNGNLIDVSVTISPIKNLRCEIIGISKIARDITDRKQLEEHIKQLAFYDSLTQLPNRRLLHDRLNHELALSKRNKKCGAVLFLDLNKFKFLNDNYGHEAGDLLLIEVAKRLKKCVRETDTVARLGGDEFIVVISGLDSDFVVNEVKMIAEKISSSLTETYKLNISNPKTQESFLEYNSSASIGISVFTGNETVEILLKKSDAAMYEAKQKNKSFCLNIDNDIS